MATVRGDGKSKPGPKPDPEVQARRQEVFDLISKGWTTRQIAEHQGRKVYQVDKDITRGAKRMLDGDGVVKQYVFMQLARLEAMWAALCKDATSPTSKRRDSAVREAVKLFERQARLLGLDAREAAEIMQIRSGLNAGGSAIDKWLLESVQDGDDFDDDDELSGGQVIEDYDAEAPPFDPAEMAADIAFMAGAAAAADPRVVDDEPEPYDPDDDDSARGVVEQEAPRAKNRRGRNDS